MHGTPLIVGIGASAGGIRALSTFLENISDTNGLAFAIVTHLSPDHESQLHKVLERKTAMPIEVARDGVRMRGGTVYVMPESAVMTIQDGCLKLERLESGHRERHPIDIFFSALAQDQRENGSIGIKVRSVPQDWACFRSS